MIKRQPNSYPNKALKKFREIMEIIEIIENGNPKKDYVNIT